MVSPYGIQLPSRHLAKTLPDSTNFPTKHTMNTPTNKPRLVGKGYMVPFILITSLFFLWGFARSVLDILNKHFQEILDISRTESSMVQFSVYVAYCLMAIPAGLVIARWGYRRGVVLGLSLFAIGAFAFVPGEMLAEGRLLAGSGIDPFWFFLVALFVLGCGLAFLETAANPYSASLGDKASAASRLNLSQSFNGLGCTVGPMIGGYMLFGDNPSLSLPYCIMGGMVVVVAFLFLRVQLPEIEDGEPTTDAATTGSLFSVWRHRAFVLGILALLCYEIAEIAINSLFVNYMTDVQHYGKLDAAKLLSMGGLLIFMLARVFGSMAMSVVRAERYLLGCAVGTVLASAGVMCDIGRQLGVPMLSIACLIAIYAFEAIMFPTIFAICLKGFSTVDTKRASSFLMMTPIGGAIGTFLMAYCSDVLDMSTAFVVPLLGYAAVMLYGIYACRQKN